MEETLDSTTPPDRGDSSDAPHAGLKPGDRFLDFEIVGVLGKGGFATVYLARDLALGRNVALKLSVNRGDEARTIANLDHENIVKVFHESVDVRGDLRVLCLQYISGTTLKEVIAFLNRENKPFCGEAILGAVDALNAFPATLSPEALEARERVARADVLESLCWLGIFVGRALAAAHHCGVLHRDIKPANVLVSQHGRWFLSDFNLAISTDRAADEEGVGGTLQYMAPEHLDAFVEGGGEAAAAVDQRSDLYSLALYALLTPPLAAVGRRAARRRRRRAPQS